MTTATAFDSPGVAELPTPTATPTPGDVDRVDWGLSNYFHLLFDRLMHAWPGKSPQRPAVGFTSCREAEGVSTVCRHLTTTAAQKLQRPVLLLDASASGKDTRNSQPPDVPGLYDVLAGEKEPADAIQPAGARWAFVLGCGTRTARQEAVFRRETFARLLDLLKREFHLIIVDLPHCQAPSDCFSMAATLDGVVLVVEAERVRSPVIARARDHLFQSGATVLGVVLNKRRNHVPEWLYRRL